MSGFKISYLPETWQYLAQCTTKPSALWTYALNNFIRQLIIDGNWQLLDRLWIFAADNQQNARVSVVNPTSTQITEVSSPAWTKNVGYTGNGSNMYLNSNFTPSTQGVNYTLNNASFGIYTSAGIIENAAQIGTYGDDSGYGRNYLQTQYKSNIAEYQVNNTSGGAIDPTNTTINGFFAVTRTASKQQNMYVNGASISSSSSTNTSFLPTIPFYILALNENGSPGAFSQATIGMAFMGSGNINQTKFYNAFTTFRNTLGF